jgi:signal peptide peptidase SppA
MKMLDIVTAPWAIRPDRLIELQEIYIAYVRGEKIDLGEVEAKLGRTLDNQPQGYTVENGVAVIPMDGVIAKRMNALHRISGGVSSELVARDFRAAMADPSVKSILFYVDSPGGAVDGTQELAREIAQARGQKSITAFSDGMMASAAYWIAAAADKIFISGDTTQVGSIGVVARHIDVSKYEEKIGVKTSEIVAGRYKRIASQHEPLSESGRRSIQDAVDHFYNVFLGDVSQFRGLSLETVKEGKADTIPWADGRIFYGKQAIAAGLVDGVSTLAALIGANSTATISGREKVRNTIASLQESGRVQEEEAAIARLPVEKRAKILWDRDAKLRAEFRLGGYPSYLAWLQHEENTRIGRR